MAAPPDSERPALTLCLLLAPRLVRGDGATHVLERKDAAMLAVLAQGGPTQRAELAALLWPDASASQARANLRQRLFRLRRTVGAPVAEKANVLSLVDGLGVDLLQAARAIAEDASACQGELLGGHDHADNDALDAWVQAAREAWRRRRLELLADCASRLETGGKLAAALVYAQRIVFEDPLLEHGYRRLMRLHYLRGDRAAAMAAYERCVELLRHELGAGPSDETRRQAELISLQTNAPASAARPVPDALRRPPQMVGRDEAWNALRRAAAEPAVMLVSADAGMGKSRLIEEFCRGRTHWCISTGRLGDDGAPYALAARCLQVLVTRYGVPTIAPEHRSILARLAPTLGAPGDAPLEAAALRVAAEQALLQWREAGLEGLVLDDLHYADEASLELLLPQATAFAESGLRWLLATRPAQGSATLTDWIAGQGGGRLVGVPLTALDRLATESLLASLHLPFDAPALWARRLVDHADGNPLFMLATLTELQATRPHGFGLPPKDLPLPRTLTDLLQGRLRQLAPLAMQLAQVAALAQGRFDAELAAAVLDCNVVALVAPWRELEEVNVFDAEGFSHATVREAVVDGIPAFLQRALHRRIASWLAAHGAPPAGVALHWWQCEAWAEAAAAYEAAANEALQLSRRPDEVAMLRQAALAYRNAGDTGPAFMCRWRAVHAALVADAIQQALDDAQALVADAADAVQKRLALEARAAVYNELTEADKALADVSAARAIEGVCDETLLVALARRESIALQRLRRSADALKVILSVRDAAMALADIDQRLGWRCDLATALDYADRLEDAVAAYAEVMVDAEASRRWIWLADAAGNQSIALMLLGRLRESRRATERAIEIGRRHAGSAGGVLIDEMSLAATLGDLGLYADAVDLGSRVGQAMRDSGHLLWAASAENDLARVYLWLGRSDLALQTLRTLPEDAPDATRAARLWTRMRIGQQFGQDMRDQFEEVARAFASAGRSHVHLRIGLERARFAEPAEAATAIAQIEARARETQQFAFVGLALTMRVDALRESGQTAEAAGQAHELLAHLRRFDAVSLYPAQPLWAAVQAFDAVADEPAALATLTQAVDWVRTTARDHVPELFRQSFLDRNPINRAILSAAGRRLKS